MKNKIKPIFLIFVVLISFMAVSDYVNADGACQGQGKSECNPYDRTTCLIDGACLWNQPRQECGPKPCDVWDYDHTTCSLQANGCTWSGECTPDETQLCGINTGKCNQGQQTCSKGGSWGICAGDLVLPRQEVCDENRLNEDCDTDENEGCGPNNYKGDGANAAGMCSLKNECKNSEEFIISLSNKENAHASLDIGYYYSSSDENAICCNFSDFKSVSAKSGSSCLGYDDRTIVSLSDYTNAHVSSISSSKGGYENDVCLESSLSGVEIDCQVAAKDETCAQEGDDKFCVLSLSSDEGNAHVASCEDTKFQYKVCCSIKGTIDIATIDSADECSGDQEYADEECVLGDDGKGHCVKFDEPGTKYFCRSTGPWWCGDKYCYPGDEGPSGLVYPEDCPSATRQKDLTNCPNDPDPCGYVQCSDGCVERPLPAGEYPYTFDAKDDKGIMTKNPYLVATEEYPTTMDWTCDRYKQNDEEGFGMHCDGAGNCVTSCIDDDGDGYGIQPDQAGLYRAESCYLGSTDLDCMDNGTSKIIDDTMNFNPYYINMGSTEPFCDCNTNTPKLDWFKGADKGVEEGPININIPLEEDFCFDGYDNDCDNLIDCFDPNCSPEGYLSQIRNRTCGVNEYGESDCTEDYQTEPEFDRACCPTIDYCVINGECVASGDLDGEFPDVHQCIMGKWYGSDYSFNVCDTIVNDTEYNTLDYSHWGLTGDAGNGTCCGDDPDEYFRKGVYASEACCSNPNAQVIGGRCVGSLKEVYTWDKTGSGFCLDDTQCIVNPNEPSFDKTVDDITSISYYSLNKVRCINNGEFIGDHYCRNGEWTSRTALLIRQLMDIGSGLREYSLFCDSYDKVLNFYGYVINEWYPAVNYFQTGEFQCEIGKGNIVPCINNLCVLKYNENNVIIGASINHDVDASSYSILEALGGTNRDCSSVLDSNTFTACGGGVYYNNKIKSIIYTKSEPSISDVLTGGEAAYIRNLFEPTLYYLQYNTPLSYDYGFVNETSNFNKIYLHKKGEKSIYIITEEIKNKKYMSATYTNFNTNICTMIENYKVANPVLVPFDCAKQGNVNYVFTGGLTEGYYDLLNDLGPKLRIK